jgi:UPF0755 protein
MNKKNDRARVNFWDYLVFILSSVAIFLSSIILALASVLFFIFKLLAKRNFWIILALSLIVFVSSLFVYWFVFSTPWKKDQGSVSLIVKEGESMQQVVKHLEEVGILSDGKILALAGEITGLDRKIRAGRYDFKRGITRLSVLRKLVKGDISYFDITIPEGLTLRQIAGILKDRIGTDSVEFVNVAKDKALAGRLGIKASSLEGYLFPNTYNLYWGISSEEAVEMMVDEFKKEFDESLRQRADQLGLSLHKVVTLASMIEKETQIDEEMSLVSSVFHNRLRLGMPLQCDPTVIYGLPELRRPLYTKDVKIDSPYNTYIHFGLPPGPICNPGRKSIIAALYPSETNYLYFVAKGDGKHIFSNSLLEHNRARQKIKKEIASQ